MLRRAKRLQIYFDCFCTQNSYNHLKLSSDEWRQVDYLITILQPFFQFTEAISVSKDVTIYIVFSVYNKLFGHIESSIRKLQQKKIGWKQKMLAALNSSMDKLREYYTLTCNKELGELYAIGTILSPQNKLQYFQTKDWKDQKIDYAALYRESLNDWIKPYWLSETQQPPLQIQKSTHSNMLSLLLSENQTEMPAPTVQGEVDRYCDSGRS
jgi:hypothetical protein